MGAWGHKSFQNDDALDLLDEFVRLGSVAVGSALDRVTELSDDDYLEAPDASAGIAAAELVAAAKSGDTSRLHEDAIEPLLLHQAAVQAHNHGTSADAAVQRVLTNSELRELWEEVDDFQLWQADVRELANRLQGS